MAAVADKIEAVEGAMPAEAGNVTDKLPVVELKPFMTKQWHPCKSMPEFYGNRSLPPNNGPGSPRKYGSGSLVSGAEAEVKKLNQDPRVFQGHDKSTPKKIKLHPPRPQTEGVLIDTEKAFATSLEREKTTLEEIKSGGTKVVFSCFRRAISDLDLRRHKDIEIRGHKMEDLSEKTPTIYANPWQFHRGRKSYSNINGSVTQSLPNPGSMNSMYLSLDNNEYSVMDESLYDAFDRSNTLPSIYVQNAPMKVKRPRAERGVRQPSGKITQKPGYRLGVANSLDVLSQCGRPAQVELYISNQLKHDIQQIKKTKDSRFMDTNGVSVSRFGGSYFTPRFGSYERVAVPHLKNLESFKLYEKNQGQNTLEHMFNLDGSSVMSASSLRHPDESKMAPSRRFRDPVNSKKDHLASHRSLIASRSSLSSSVSNAAVSARVLSMMRAETLPAIAPGNGVIRFKELTSSRLRSLSNSAPEIRGQQQNGIPTPESRISNALMPKIDLSDYGPKSSPVSSRSSVSDECLKQNNVKLTNAEQYSENGMDEIKVIDRRDGTTENKRDEVIQKPDFEKEPRHENKVVLDENSNLIDIIPKKTGQDKFTI